MSTLQDRGNGEGILSLTEAELDSVAGAGRWHCGARGGMKEGGGYKLEPHDGHLDVIFRTGRGYRRLHLMELRQTTEGDNHDAH